MVVRKFLARIYAIHAVGEALIAGAEPNAQTLERAGLGDLNPTYLRNIGASKPQTVAVRPSERIGQAGLFRYFRPLGTA